MAAPYPNPFPCALALPPTSHRDTTALSPCWAFHFMTQERLMFSNSTPSEPRLFPTATMSDDILSDPTSPLHCASILQPATSPHVVAFESWTILTEQKCWSHQSTLTQPLNFLPHFVSHQEKKSFFLTFVSHQEKKSSFLEPSTPKVTLPATNKSIPR